MQQWCTVRCNAVCGETRLLSIRSESITFILLRSLTVVWLGLIRANDLGRVFFFIAFVVKIGK